METPSSSINTCHVPGSRRCVGPQGGNQWDHRGHFFAAAAEAMRRLLVEKARRNKRRKHGGGRRRVSLDEVADSIVKLIVTRLGAPSP